MGWFQGKRTLTITLDSEFEGFYGLASEGWEQQVKIEFKSANPPHTITVKGNRFETIDQVCGKIITMIENFDNKK